MLGCVGMNIVISIILSLVAFKNLVSLELFGG